MSPSGEAGASAAEVARRIAEALGAGDVAAMADLLDADARWGSDDHPRRCRGRDDVVALLSAGFAFGARAEAVKCRAVEGPSGAVVVCALRVRWPDPTDPAAGPRRRPARLWHVYALRDGLVAEILPCASRRDADAVAARRTGAQAEARSLRSQETKDDTDSAPR